MKKRVLLALMLLTGASTVGRAAGTPDQQDACRPDVRKFCHHLKPGSGDNIFLSCLQEHREKLSAKCRKVLESNGV